MTSVAVMVGIFFIIGITVGVIIVIAASALRRDRQDGPDDWPGRGPAGPDERPPDPDSDGNPTDRYPWWQARDEG